MAKLKIGNNYIEIQLCESSSMGVPTVEIYAIEPNAKYPKKAHLGRVGIMDDETVIVSFPHTMKINQTITFEVIDK